METSPVRVAIIGCGNRGQNYAEFHWLHPDKCQVVAIAEPRKFTREMMAKKFSLPDDRVFEDWKQVTALGQKISDAVVIATQDSMHVEPAIAFASLGYHILLEKPMAPNEEDCKRIYESIEKNKVIFAIGHVLRYTPYSRKVKEILDSGAIGEIINIQHLEPVGWYHHAHSYVRGNWRKESESSFMLLAKSCHDIDWINWVMNSKCKKVTSFGSLNHFKKENKPKEAASRCLDCSLADTCAYSAKTIYLDPVVNSNYTGWPIKVLAENPNEETITEALKSGPYGRCVYECDNDVVDNQVVNMMFEGGKTASFTMVAFSKEICVRKTRIFGTLGELEGDGENQIKVYNFSTRQMKVHTPDQCPVTKMLGHGGGDYFLMKSFIEAVATNDQSKVCPPQQTLESHLLVFEAERSRLEDSVRSLNW
eukprot:TRINITY_DN6407_c0_g1_i1.p1 TRINITY_DN6407_c0_g1~~TRINITY_DN6407_c0_g1_i1.p1  ORF type:complete len:422 (-),score=65.95 TRINITY_DN6407_c0_g1_i1:15-1280(-)